MARILIVGAGPAGMSTALFLSKMGIASTLVDKAGFPRDKICGDGLSGWVLHMLYRLDPAWVRELSTQPGALPSNGMRFYAPNLKHLTLPYYNKKEADLAAGYIIRRKEFDSFLWQKVKQNPLIETIEGFEAVNFQLDNDSALVRGILSPAFISGQPPEVSSETSELRADMVVFCDGATSRFAQNPGGIKKSNPHHATGIKVYYRGLQTCDPILNPVEFYFLKQVLPGYLWIFPLPGGEANVGLGIRTDVMKRKKIRLKDTLLQCIHENPLLRERFKNAEAISEVQAWGLPLGSRQWPLSGERFLLAGDAASLIDPFTGEGVGNAINSGFHAAEHIRTALEKGRYDAAFNRQYDIRVYQKLWKELKNSHMIQRLLMYPGLFSMLMNRAVNSRYLQQSLIKMIDDLNEREKLGQPAFYLKALFKR